MILAIRTDSPLAELYLVGSTGQILGQHEFQADRKLASMLNREVDRFLSSEGGFAALEGVAYFSGSGSFTGLRIGASVANALGYSLGIPVGKVSGKDWIDMIPSAVAGVKLGEYPAPDYDREANITR
jgi:tRNA threonylcarbamoyladenosine biosynthesis protein TsaB